MGRIAELLEYTRVSEEGITIGEVKVDCGGGDIVTAMHYAPPGDDSHPLPGDLVFLQDSAGTGNFVAVGFVDPKIIPEAEPGERIIFSRSGPGQIAAKIHLKANGSVVINDKVEISPEGDVSTSGDVSSDGTVTGAIDCVGGGISSKGHMHPAGTLLDSLNAPVKGNTGLPT